MLSLVEPCRLRKQIQHFHELTLAMLQTFSPLGSKSRAVLVGLVVAKQTGVHLALDVPASCRQQSLVPWQRITTTPFQCVAPWGLLGRPVSDKLGPEAGWAGLRGLASRRVAGWAGPEPSLRHVRQAWPPGGHAFQDKKAIFVIFAIVSTFSTKM